MNDKFPRPPFQAVPDQRSLSEQLMDLIVLANRRGLYDAADYLAKQVPVKDAVDWVVKQVPIEE